MFNFFNKQPNARKAGKAQSSPSTQPPDTVPISTQQNKSNFRDLTRVVLRDTMRMNGVPLDWISCEANPRKQDRHDGSLLIQLVIQRWHDGLLLHAPLIQEQLLQGMQRFDPASDHSKHMVVWKIAPDCGYAKTAMPAPDFWLTHPAAATSKQKFDLPPSDRDHGADDFAATVPAEFHPTEPGDFR